MRSNWPTEFSVAHRFHMAHIAALIEEAHQHDYESALYHVYDCVLNFTALRTSNYSHDDYISIYPQAVLSLREDPVVLDVEPADRITRSNVGNVDAALAELSLDDIGDGHTDSESTASSSRITSVRTNQSEEPQQPKKRNRTRTPDFLTILTHADRSRRLLFIHEVKPLPPMPTMNSTKAQVLSVVRGVINHMRKQIIEQAQFAFEEFPEQQMIYNMCIVGIHFSVLKFHRDTTPRFGEYAPRISTSVGRIGEVFKDDMSDLSAIFKMWWTRIKNLQKARA